MRVILASASPRRSEILTQAGIDFETVISGVKELYSSIEPENIVKELSDLKSSDIASKTEGSAVIIGADTVVAIQNRILGKPKDAEEAFDMLQELQGNTHQVYTGVTLIIRSNDSYKKIMLSECTQVTVYPMSVEQIKQYIETREPFDKAGAYGIQGKFAIYIKGISGDYYNVVGLPIAAIYQKLDAEGIRLIESPCSD